MSEKIPTIENDGSVEGDPCHMCEGTLVLRRVPTGGFILGCSNYGPSHCEFKMAPNSDAMERMETERAERRAIRAAKRKEKEEIEAKKLHIKTMAKDVFCERCGAQLTTIRKFAGLKTCKACE